MSEELRALKDAKRELEERYAEAKGLIEGVRIGRQLTSTEKDILKLLENITLKLLEFMMKEFKSSNDAILSILEQKINMTQKINSLETRVKELEEAMNQLRTTIDTLGESR
jgi:DNA repair exonuclease SbcCD ATPase subunit